MFTVLVIIYYFWAYGAIKADLAIDRVDDRGLVKVADFGLSRELIVQDYYRLCHSKTPVPVRWMAPESLNANVFTTMSDVVSFCYLLTLLL